MMAKRLLMSLFGVLVCAFSVGMFNLAAFGVDPFQCFAQGLHLPLRAQLSYGSFYFLLSIAFLLIVFAWDKHYLGMATFINMFLTGYIVDYSFRLLKLIFPGELSLGFRALLLLLAVVIMCFGSALYFTADLGVSVYDALALIMAEKKIRLYGRILPFKLIRVCTDLVCVLIGMLFGKLPGIGTLLTAFFMGPLISFFNDTVARPLLYGKKQLLAAS